MSAVYGNVRSRFSDLARGLRFATLDPGSGGAADLDGRLLERGVAIVYWREADGQVRLRGWLLSVLWLLCLYMISRCLTISNMRSM